MTTYPRDLAPPEIPESVSVLVLSLAARLLDGPTAEHSVLREQLATAHLSRVSLTGAGLYAYFGHPPDTPLVSPPEMIGGDVSFEVRTLDAPAGSLVDVSLGLLAFVEIYTFGNVPWPDEPELIAYRYSVPLPVRGGPPE